MASQLEINNFENIVRGVFEKATFFTSDPYIEIYTRTLEELEIEYRVINGTGALGMKTVICQADQLEDQLTIMEREIKKAEEALARRKAGLVEHRGAEEDDELRFSYTEQLLQELAAEDGRLIITLTNNGRWLIEVEDNLSSSLVEIVTEVGAPLEDALRQLEAEAENALADYLDD